MESGMMYPYWNFSKKSFSFKETKSIMPKDTVPRNPGIVTSIAYFYILGNNANVFQCVTY
jgi:hypothetical protein